MNTEVEVFGVSTEYFFIKYRGEFGFFPKQHLKERAKVDFTFPVMLDIEELGNIKQLKQKNFLNLYSRSKTGQLDAALAGLDNLTVEEKKPEVPDLTKTIEASPPVPEKHIIEDTTVNKTGTESGEQKIPSNEPVVDSELRSGEDVNNKVAPGSTSEPGIEVSSEEQDNEDDDDEDEDEEDSEEDDTQPELLMIPPNPNPTEQQANLTEESKNIVDPLNNDDKLINEDTPKPPVDEKANDLPLTNVKVDDNQIKIESPVMEEKIENLQPPTESLNIPIVAATETAPSIPESVKEDIVIPVHEEVNEMPLLDQPKTYEAR